MNPLLLYYQKTAPLLTWPNSHFHLITLGKLCIHTVFLRGKFTVMLILCCDGNFINWPTGTAAMLVVSFELASQKGVLHYVDGHLVKAGTLQAIMSNSVAGRTAEGRRGEGRISRKIVLIGRK